MNMKILEQNIARGRDESGDSRRASGRTSRMILTAILEASKGEKVMVGAYAPHYAKDIKYKCCEVIATLLNCESFTVNGNMITMIGGGVICIASWDKQGIINSYFKHEDGSKVKFTKHINDHYWPKGG